MPTEGTSPTQIRLSDADRAKIEAVRVRFGLPSFASAIRYSVETVFRAEGLAVAASPPAKGPAAARSPAPKKPAPKKTRRA